MDDVMAHLAARRARDRLLGSTTSGPHRDACSYIHGRAGTTRTSPPRGSCVSVRSCFALPRPRFLAARTGRKPILLLDDVLLELDPGRKRAFIARFPPYEQAFFTFLPDESWQSFRTPDTHVLTSRKWRLPAVKKVGELLKDFLREKGWLAGNPYEPLFAEWKRITGEALAGHSRLVDVQNGILLVEVDHPGWLQMLQLRKASILAAARRTAPLASVEGIRVRLGTGDH